MTPHLLALSVGPVQEFISAARRTRDLWFGSELLSEISKAVAASVAEQVGIEHLIFPAPASDADLRAHSSFNVANVVVAEIRESDPAEVAKIAKDAARDRWREFAEDVFERCHDVIRSDLWNAQVDDVFEFYAAWYPFTLDKYQNDRIELMRLLAARKRCRDFKPANGRSGVFKSSLDGLRESVLRESRNLPGGMRRLLRLNEGEQLDVVGMVKRVWISKKVQRGYPSVERVAADPWLRRISKADLQELTSQCRELNEKFGEIVHRIGSDNPQYAAFPFEGTPVFPSRYKEFGEEAEIEEHLLDLLRNTANTLIRKYRREPSPYLAILFADGDRMGQALSKLNSPDEHREFSRALAEFAAQAREIVRDNFGVLIYSGGDDVLALLPVDKCLECARELHDNFAGQLAEWARLTDSPLTLSVGIAIGHFMEPLEDLLEYGRDAESHAKTPASRG
jgi:CRISPR-associated protein Cmr2